MRSTSLFTTALRSLPIFTACLALPNLSFAGDYTWAKPRPFPDDICIHSIGHIGGCNDRNAFWSV